MRRGGRATANCCRNRGTTRPIRRQNQQSWPTSPRTFYMTRGPIGWSTGIFALGRTNGPVGPSHHTDSALLNRRCSSTYQDLCFLKESLQLHCGLPKKTHGGHLKSLKFCIKCNFWAQWKNLSFFKGLSRFKLKLHKTTKCGRILFCLCWHYWCYSLELNTFHPLSYDQMALGTELQINVYSSEEGNLNSDDALISAVLGLKIQNGCLC